ncbi:hypothetical protein PHYSODRAFT_328945 [Phytophthora sojae]|uniref:Uncharacterized protein n=1 Tax=Phytophthora sojae (strain P6497) TaxID=1094619 RepID=G4Z5A5_PHYSP|nr:hypothetical protein PHYSODRAFT_328945 [Phytophthora sojae]EGZ20890.1 hypothetical protein PHYSODRAFT_328945 [Phytophthora sojae]|eukprot:XP_009523607.1 hypothetical protein PHYSODRAFT_328945 [Phytophthora sojae]
MCCGLRAQLVLASTHDPPVSSVSYDYDYDYGCDCDYDSGLTTISAAGCAAPFVFDSYQLILVRFSDHPLSRASAACPCSPVRFDAYELGVSGEDLHVQSSVDNVDVPVPHSPLRNYDYKLSDYGISGGLLCFLSTVFISARLDFYNDDSSSEHYVHFFSSLITTTTILAKLRAVRPLLLRPNISGVHLRPMSTTTISVSSAFSDYVLTSRLGGPYVQINWLSMTTNSASLDFYNYDLNGGLCVQYRPFDEHQLMLVRPLRLRLNQRAVRTARFVLDAYISSASSVFYVYELSSRLYMLFRCFSTATNSISLDCHNYVISSGLYVQSRSHLRTQRRRQAARAVSSVHYDYDLGSGLYVQSRSSSTATTTISPVHYDCNVCSGLYVQSRSSSTATTTSRTSSCTCSWPLGLFFDYDDDIDYDYDMSASAAGYACNRRYQRLRQAGRAAPFAFDYYEFMGGQLKQPGSLPTTSAPRSATTCRWTEGNSIYNNDNYYTRARHEQRFDYKYDNNRVHIDDHANEYDKTTRDYGYGGNHDCRYNDNDAHDQHYDCSNHNDFGYDGDNSDAYDCEHKHGKEEEGAASFGLPPMAEGSTSNTRDTSRIPAIWRSVYSLSDVGTEHEERMATTLRLKDDYIAFDVLSITDPRLSFALRGTTDVTPDQSNPLSR